MESPVIETPKRHGAGSFEEPRLHHRCNVSACLVGERDGNDDRARTLADEW